MRSIYDLTHRSVYTYPKPMFNTLCENLQEFRSCALYSAEFDEGLDIASEYDNVFEDVDADGNGGNDLHELPENGHRVQSAVVASQSSESSQSLTNDSGINLSENHDSSLPKQCADDRVLSLRNVTLRRRRYSGFKASETATLLGNEVAQVSHIDGQSDVGDVGNDDIRVRSTDVSSQASSQSGSFGSILNDDSDLDDFVPGTPLPLPNLRLPKRTKVLKLPKTPSIHHRQEVPDDCC